MEVSPDQASPCRGQHVSSKRRFCRSLISSKLRYASCSTATAFFIQFTWSVYVVLYFEGSTTPHHLHFGSYCTVLQQHVDTPATNDAGLPRFVRRFSLDCLQTLSLTLVSNLLWIFFNKTPSLEPSLTMDFYSMKEWSTGALLNIMVYVTATVGVQSHEGIFAMSFMMWP